MPSVFKFMGYVFYFWSREDGEPVHIHVAKGRAHADATKFWLLRSGEALLVHNKSKISEKDLKKIKKVIEDNKDEIMSKWFDHFDSIEFYNKLGLVNKK